MTSGRHLAPALFSWHPFSPGTGSPSPWLPPESLSCVSFHLCSSLLSGLCLSAPLFSAPVSVCLRLLFILTSNWLPTQTLGLGPGSPIAPRGAQLHTAVLSRDTGSPHSQALTTPGHHPGSPSFLLPPGDGCKRWAWGCPGEEGPKAWLSLASLSLLQVPAVSLLFSWLPLVAAAGVLAGVQLPPSLPRPEDLPTGSSWLPVASCLFSPGPL